MLEFTSTMINACDLQKSLFIWSRYRVGLTITCVRLHCIQIKSPDLCYFLFSENYSPDSALSSPSALNSPGLGVEGLNRRRKKRTSIETNIRVALEKSFLEVSDPVALLSL